jgi:hypothetical protein
MSGTLAAQIVIPIVALVALFGWLILVLRADNHPGWKHHGNLPKNEVAGGAFQALGGGRQLMPTHGGRPMATDAASTASAGIPEPRTASEQEVPAPRPESGGDRHLVAGGKLR